MMSPDFGLAARLDAAVKAVCPAIHGVSIGIVGDKNTWRINFDEAATKEDRAAATKVLAEFDQSPELQLFSDRAVMESQRSITPSASDPFR